VGQRAQSLEHSNFEDLWKFYKFQLRQRKLINGKKYH
jgi:hypothetical protein